MLVWSAPRAGGASTSTSGGYLVLCVTIAQRGRRAARCPYVQLIRVLACLALVLPAIGWGLARPVAADTVSAVQMLALHNQMRYAIGAPTIPGDPRVVLAAQRHADYSSLNGTGGHYEVAGNPGYSGYGPRERVAAAGWNTTFVSEVAAGYRGALYAVSELWHAPYHRLGMMHPSAIATGWGHSDLNSRSTTVGNLVYDFGARAVDFVRSPATVRRTSRRPGAATSRRARCPRASAARSAIRSCSCTPAARPSTSAAPSSSRRAGRACPSTT